MALTTSTRAPSAAAACSALVSACSTWMRMASTDCRAACCRRAINCWISAVAPAVRWARERTSSATTAKPRPISPARAASIAALSASRLVCSAMARITVSTLSMVSVSSARRSTAWALFCTSPTSWCSPARLWSITLWPCSTARPASRLASAARLASPATCWMVASSSPRASRICAVPPAWCSAPACRPLLSSARALLLSATCSACWRMVPTSSPR
ncbi:hypothetical protein D3C85_1176340 [compost metagenome]